MGFSDRPSRPGDPLRASDVNELKRVLRAGRVVVDGSLERDRRAGGTTVRLSGRRRCRFVKTGASGVPAASSDQLTPGSATARIYFFNGTTLADSGVDLVVWNVVPTAVAASKICQVKYIDGFPFIDLEPC